MAIHSQSPQPQQIEIENRREQQPLMSKCSRFEIDAYYETKNGERIGTKIVVERDRTDDQRESGPLNEVPDSRDRDLDRESQN